MSTRAFLAGSELDKGCQLRVTSPSHRVQVNTSSRLCEDPEYARTANEHHSELQGHSATPYEPMICS